MVLRSEFPGDQLRVSSVEEKDDPECFHVVLENVGDVLYTSGTHV
jgi:hypothetical protein